MDQPPIPASAASEALGKISKRIEEDESAAYAEFVKQMQSSEDRRGPILWFLGQKFEIHAYYHSFLVTDYEAIKGWYEPDLQNRQIQSRKDRRGPILWFLGQKFEIHAYYHSFLVTDYEAIKGWYEPDLQNR